MWAGLVTTSHVPVATVKATKVYETLSLFLVGKKNTYAVYTILNKAMVI